MRAPKGGLTQGCERRSHRQLRRSEKKSLCSHGLALCNRSIAHRLNARSLMLVRMR